MEFILPDSVMNILSRLETDGFSAFVAGGAVRDTIMGKTPHDYDIATSARPEEVKKLRKRKEIEEMEEKIKKMKSEL